jgi:hypothetical protein
MDMRQALAARQIRNGIAPDVQPQPGMGKWEAMIRALGQDATNIDKGLTKLGSNSRELMYGDYLANTRPDLVVLSSDFTPEEIREAGEKKIADSATDLAAMTIGAGAAPVVGKTAMGMKNMYNPAQMNIFANAWNGKGADTGKTMSAMRMHEAGASPQEIWAKTQRMQDGHGNWVDEIDDSGAKFIENPNIPDGVEPTLKDYLDHPALYERYPELGETAAWKTNSPEMNPGEGAYSPPGVTEKGEVTFKPTQPYSKDYQYEADADNLKLLLHEAGHGVQEFGGMPRGGSPDMFMAKNSGNHTQTQLANRLKLIQALQDEGYTTNEIGSLMKSENSRGGFSTDTLEMKDGKEFGFNDLNMTQSQLDNQPSVPVGYMNEARDVQGMLDLKKSVSRDPNERYESYTDLWGEQSSNAAMNRAGLDAAGRAERFPGLDFKTPQDKALYHYDGKDGWNELPEVSAATQRGKFKTDVPTEEWLADKVDYIKSQGLNKHGAPQFGSVTGYYSGPERFPVSELKKLRGLRGEQGNVRQDDLDWLVKNMDETGKLPLTDSGKEYAPFVTVDHTGTPWVNEGNHRIMAADKLGWEDLPVEIRYFDGGERQARGVFKPE